MSEQSPIEICFQVYAEEGGETFGAVRGLVPQTNALLIYIENAGDFEVPAEVEWFANIDNPRTRRASQIDLRDFTQFAGSGIQRNSGSSLGPT